MTWIFRGKIVWQREWRGYDVSKHFRSEILGDRHDIIVEVE
jgi:hypothetical protein